MLTQRYNRRPYMANAASERRPRLVARLLTIGIALLIIWYLGGKVLSLFVNSTGHRNPAILTTERDSQDVQISLQSGEWQRAENNIKIYPGDAVSTKGNGNAIITFFDGTHVRLDANTEAAVEKSDKYEEDTSSVSLKLRSGRLWVSTPSVMAFSGSIVRKVATDAYSAELPGETNALLSTSLVAVLRAQGLGLSIDVLQPKNSNQIVVVGEGQQLTLSEDARNTIAAGDDPYRYRDPIGSTMLNDEFFLRSYAMLKDIATGSGALTGGVDLTQRDDLVITAPENNARVTGKTVTVAGRVSERIKTLIINNSITAVKPDKTFSVDVALAGETMAIHIEAQDDQGVALAKQDRSVKVELNPYRETVTMNSPVGSGKTLTTSATEIDVSGLAPANAASIWVNDYKLQLFKAGSKTWSYLASRDLGNLVDGKNTLTIYAMDKDGRKGPTTTIYIVYDPAATATVPTAVPTATASSQPPLKQNPPLTPGTLAVTAPAPGTTAEATAVENVIEGTTSAETAFISVNGYTLSLYIAGKTTWNYIASVDLGTMKEGKNVYRVVSRNKDGEILDVLEYTINYTPAR